MNSHARPPVDIVKCTSRRALSLSALSLAGLLVSCGLLDPELGGTGTIVFEDIEGGCWLIDTATERYNPVNLPHNLRIEGLAVLFEGSSRPELSHFCPGVIIDLSWIGELDEESG